MVNKEKLLILGSGYMAKEYIKVISELQHEIVIISKSKINFDYFKSNYENVSLYSTSEISTYNKIRFSDFSFAINCVSIEKNL